MAKIEETKAKRGWVDMDKMVWLGAREGYSFFLKSLPKEDVDSFDFILAASAKGEVPSIKKEISLLAGEKPELSKNLANASLGGHLPAVKYLFSQVKKKIDISDILYEAARSGCFGAFKFLLPQKKAVLKDGNFFYPPLPPEIVKSLLLAGLRGPGNFFISSSVGLGAAKLFTFFLSEEPAYAWNPNLPAPPFISLPKEDRILASLKFLRSLQAKEALKRL